MRNPQQIFSTCNKNSLAHTLRIFSINSQKLKKSIILLFLSALFISFFTPEPARAALQRYTLSGVMPDFGDVYFSPSAKISPDGKYVVYVSDQQTDYEPGLYVTPIDGSSAPVRVSLPASLTAIIRDFAISPDSRRIVYLVDLDIFFDAVQDQLYSVPITGGTTTTLNGPLAAQRGVQDFQISPDSSRVVYRADQDTDNVSELYSVPLAGGTVTKLNGPLVTGGSVWSYYQVSPDSSRVVYWAVQDTTNVQELYSVPIRGGNATKLNGQLVAGGNVSSSASNSPFLISSDSNRVVYRADQNTDEVYELFSVPIGGGTATKLNGPLVAGGDVHYYFLISPDGKRVVYLADQATDEVDELYSVPIGGGTATKLNTPPVAGGEIFYFYQISPDSSRVVYWADQDTDNVEELYTVPINGGTVTKLNDPMVAGGNVDVFLISPDNSRVVYRADQETDTVYELFSVPVTGGTVTKLNKLLPAGGIVYSFFLISPDSRRVIFQGDQETDTVVELFSVPVDGGTVAKLNGPLVAGGNVTSFADFRYDQDFLISPDSSRVVYIADQRTDEVFELYGVYDDSYNKSLLNLFVPAILSGSINLSTCKEIAGNWSGSWSETSCDGERYSGGWTGTVYENCIFFGTDNWDSVEGAINPSTMVLTGSGISRDGCGTFTVRGMFNRNGSVTGSYTYGFGGGGSFSGALIQN